MSYISRSEKGIRERLEMLGVNSYSDYLKSEHWIELRKRFYRSNRIEKLKKKYGRLVCEFCKKDGKFNLHHKTYKNLGHESKNDIFLICETCHSKIHSMSREFNLYERTKMLRRSLKRGKHRGKARRKIEIMTALAKFPTY